MRGSCSVSRDTQLLKGGAAEFLRRVDVVDRRPMCRCLTVVVCEIHQRLIFSDGQRVRSPLRLHQPASIALVVALDNRAGDRSQEALAGGNHRGELRVDVDLNGLVKLLR